MHHRRGVMGIDGLLAGPAVDQKNRLRICSREEIVIAQVAFLGDRLLAPYFCMGLTMLSILTDEGPITVNEADYVVIGDNGEISIE